MRDREISVGTDQIGDVELNAVVGGRTEVTKAQYEQILAQRIADQNKPWWKFW
jgi:hypothetical protein